MKKLTVKNNQFFLDDTPFQILSGAVHYFRIVPEYWEDRLRKVKAAGLNTVETYIPWNFHERQKRVFTFTGNADVERFVKLAGSLGLYVIIRPSPYICAEWEAGGLPFWLLQDSSLKIRCCYEPYLQHIQAYYHELLPRLVPLQSTHGGPIIAMQIENEYGSFGNDTAYLQWLKAAMKDEGIDVLLFTSDGPTPLMLSGGTIPGVLPTVNFGSKPAESFQCFHRFFPEAPDMVTEFWNGWFDHWGEPHHTQDAAVVAEAFRWMLEHKVSVNFYMFHGGTNFGFYSGANFSTQYEPTVTSYDYDCPVSEWGCITPKFTAIRDAIMQYTGATPEPVPPLLPRIEPGTVQHPSRIELFSALPVLSKPLSSAYPLTMEQTGQDYGFMLYRTTLRNREEPGTLTIKGLRDRAQVFFTPVQAPIHGKCTGQTLYTDAAAASKADAIENSTARRYLGTLYRNDTEPEAITIPAESGILEILVENMGRINYGAEMFDAKGITQGVYIDYQRQFNWEQFPLPLTSLAQLTTLTPLTFTGAADTARTSATTEQAYADRAEEAVSDGIPAFYQFSFTLKKTGDTFIDMSGWTKGVIFVNDVNIGRYWSIGPQKRLYIPAPLLRTGENIIIVFELHGTQTQRIYLSAEPDLGETGRVS